MIMGRRKDASELLHLLMQNSCCISELFLYTPNIEIIHLTCTASTMFFVQAVECTCFVLFKMGVSGCPSSCNRDWINIDLLPQSPLLSVSVNGSVHPLHLCLRHSSDLVSSAEWLILHRWFWSPSPILNVDCYEYSYFILAIRNI